MALHGLERLEAGAFDGHQLIADRQKPLGDDVQSGRRHKMVNVGDASGDGILDGNHSEIDVARDERGKTILEGRAGHGFVIRIGFTTGKM